MRHRCPGLVAVPKMRAVLRAIARCRLAAERVTSCAPLTWLLPDSWSRARRLRRRYCFPCFPALSARRPIRRAHDRILQERSSRRAGSRRSQRRRLDDAVCRLGRALCHDSSRHDGRGWTTASPGGRGHADRPAPGSMQTSYESLPPRSPGCFIRDRAAIAALAHVGPSPPDRPVRKLSAFQTVALACPESPALKRLLGAWRP